MKKILIAEDDLTLSRMYKKKLENYDFEVLQAMDGEEALKISLGDHPDLILLDIDMPKMDGITMIKKLREDVWGKEVPVIIFTNQEASDDRLKDILENHPAFYLVKSNTEPWEIVEKIEEVLHMK